MPGIGFRLARSLGMEGTTGNLHDFPISPSYSTSIFKGGLVTLSAGFVQVGVVTPTSKYLGIFWGCKYEDANGDFVYANMWDGGANRTNIQAQIGLLPAGASALVKGVDGATYTAADIGVRKTFVENSGNTRTGMSGATLAGPGASTANAGLIVMQKIDFADGSDWFEVALAADSAILQSGP